MISHKSCTRIILLAESSFIDIYIHNRNPMKISTSLLKLHTFIQLMQKVIFLCKKCHDYLTAKEINYFLYKLTIIFKFLYSQYYFITLLHYSK